MNRRGPEMLGDALAGAALRTLISICPEVRAASSATLDAACAAMRAAAPGVIDGLLADVAEVPALAEISFIDAALTLAHAGAKVVRGIES